MLTNCLVMSVSIRSDANQPTMSVSIGSHAVWLYWSASEAMLSGYVGQHRKPCCLAMSVSIGSDAERTPGQFVGQTACDCRRQPVVMRSPLGWAWPRLRLPGPLGNVDGYRYMVLMRNSPPPSPLDRGVIRSCSRCVSHRLKRVDVSWMRRSFFGLKRQRNKVGARGGLLEIRYKCFGQLQILIHFHNTFC